MKKVTNGTFGHECLNENRFTATELDHLDLLRSGGSRMMMIALSGESP